MEFYSSKKQTQFWCLSCDHAVSNDALMTLLQTVYKLTKKGPIPYGMCKKCHGGVVEKKNS